MEAPVKDHRISGDILAGFNQLRLGACDPSRTSGRRQIARLTAVAWSGAAVALLLTVFMLPTQAQQKDDQRKGTGIVPPGIRLASQMPAAAPTNPFHFPRAVTKTLDNGLRAYVISDSEQPAISIRLVVTSAGSINDPPGKPGIANMTADMLTQGTASRTAEQIAQAIDFVGGSLSASADEDGTYITANIVKKDFALAMDLLSDIVLHPAFKKEELDRRRQQALSNLQVQYSDPGYIADAALSRLVYGKHPYGLPVSGTPDSLRAIASEDLAGFQATYYTPESALLAFAGDIKPEDAFAAAAKYLGSSVWPRRQVNSTAIPAAGPILGIRIVFIDKPDANQTQIRVGHLGIPRNNPDSIPLYVTNRIFGGGFNSRLSTEVRQKKGLTYGAYSRFESHRLAGDFSASTFTRTDATVEATKLVVDLVKKMSDGELGPQELDFARDYLAGVFPIQSETGEQVASRILTSVQYGLPADYNDTYQQKVLAVGPADVRQMAARYFDATNLVIVLVGNTKAFSAAIRASFPKAVFEELPFDQIDLQAPDLRKAKPAAHQVEKPGF
jgi:zinc protease